MSTIKAIITVFAWLFALWTLYEIRFFYTHHKRGKPWNTTIHYRGDWLQGWLLVWGITAGASALYFYWASVL
jgi:hypothetical protein